MPNDEESKPSEDLIKDKILITTYHQSKGLERKVVIVMNFDYSYFKYFKKDLNPLVCPNEMYVATSRSLERLSLIHNYKHDYLPFLDYEKINSYCDIINKKRLCVDKRLKDSEKNKFSVKELVSHLPINVVSKIHNRLYHIKKNKYNI